MEASHVIEASRTRKKTLETLSRVIFGSCTGVQWTGISVSLLTKRGDEGTGPLSHVFSLYVRSDEEMLQHMTADVDSDSDPECHAMCDERVDQV